MAFRRFLVLLFLLSGVFGLHAVSGAVVQGDIYSIYLEPLTNVVVEIDTTPHQVIVSKDGTYSFTVPVGMYTLTAQQSNGETYSAEEKLDVTDEGTYTVDLLLNPVLDEDIEGFDEVAVFEQENVGFETFNTVLMYLSVLIVVLVVVYLIVIRRHFLRHHDETIQSPSSPVENTSEELTPDIDGQAEQVVNYLRKEGGRVNQKNLRKVFHISEAKMSLLLADMEHRGLVKKIKQGRGNIVVLHS